MSQTYIHRWLALVWLCLCACSSLPAIESVQPQPGASAVRLEGVRGALSAAQSKAILERLARSGQPTSIFDRHLALEEGIVGSPLTTGNAVKLLQDGPATYQAMYAAILTAKDHINMETYILDDDEVGQRFVDALINKQRQGVQVNLIHDSVGTRNTPRALFERMASVGIKLLEFNPINPASARGNWELNRRDHRKLLVVDGQTAFLGGINISSVYSGGSFRANSRAKIAKNATGEVGAPDAPQAPAWRDTDLQLQGPVVAELQKLFLATWAKQKGAALPARHYFPPPVQAGAQVVRAIGSSPDDAFSLIYATLLSAIASAETSVSITNAYFAPDPQLLATLAAAAARGVDVKLILPSQTDSWLVFHAGRAYYAQLLQAGVKIYERSTVILHSKTALVDGVWATVGSTNLDWRSFLHNDELNAVVLGADFGRQVQAMFDKDLAASRAITLTDWERRPLQFRVKESFARLWEYWL